jgi:hypothetical protein
MTSYDISGTFYEACDCEVICPCWAGLPPDMGSCTGLFVWEIDEGNVDGISVKGSKVAVLSSGLSCDISKYMLVLVQGPEELGQAFNASGPWHDVFQAQSFSVDTIRMISPARIEITDSGSSVSISIQDPLVPLTPAVVTTAKLGFTVKPVSLTGENQNLLIDRVVSRAPNKSVAVGVVDTPVDATQNGLNLLADIPNEYTFDLDVSRVTAMRGTFHYVQPV